MNAGDFFREHQWEIIFALIFAVAVVIFWETIKKLFTSVLRLLKDLFSRRKFERNYRNWLISRFRFLNVRGIKPHAPVTVELERVFVSLRTKKRPERQDALPDEAEKELFENSDQEQREFLERTLLRKEEQRLQAEKTYELKDLFSLPQKRFIIIGKPGSGKTTLLSFLALKFARRSAEELFGSDNEMLPVFVNLRDTIKQGFLDVKTFGEKYGIYIECAHPAPTDFFKQRLDDGKCLVLLDGLDEVSRPEDRVDVAKWVDRLTSAYPKNVFIATSRPYGYETTRLYNDFLELHILDFTPEQVEEFVRYWTKAVEIKARGDESEFTLKEAEKKAEDLLKAVKDSPKIEVLTVNPLLLTIVSLVHRYRATLPKRRVELYEECCDILLGYWDTAKGMASELQPRQKRTVLQPIAYHLHRNGLREEKRDKVVELLKGELPKIGVSEDKAGELLDDARHRCGMLVETKLGYFGFAHLTFQEFLAARFVLENGLENLLISKRRDKYWLEVTLLYCGMRDTTNLLKKILETKEDIFHTNLLLAGRCLIDSLLVSPELRVQILDSLFDLCWNDNDFEASRQPTLETLIETKDKGTLEKLVNKTHHQDSSVRCRAASALAQTGAQDAILPLVNLLRDKKTVVRGRAASALGQIQAKEAVPSLIQLLEDKQKYVRGRAASALGEMHAQEAVLHLIQLLSDKKDFVRGRAASALGHMQAYEAIPALVNLLTDRRFHIRRRASHALGNIGGDQALMLIIDLADSRQSYARASAALALGQAKATKALAPLIHLLKDRNSYIRGCAASALGQTQSKKALSPLIQALGDTEASVRGRAASGLGEIQAQEAVPALIQLLNDKVSDVRCRATSALGQIQAKEAIPHLVQLLNDKMSDVRYRAASALGQIQAKEAIPPLIQLLNDEVSYVRARAASALAQIQAEEAIPTLIELLKDEESYVRWGVACALAQIQAKEAEPPLIELLKDTESYVRWSVAYALGEIGDLRAVESLKSLLADTGIGPHGGRVRDCAFLALRTISEKSGTPIYRN